jgi:outer membrane protein OmpA-like peptidoglycan-associated protein
VKSLFVIGLLVSRLALADGCLPLSGVVQDYDTHHPLASATLWLKMPVGKQKAGVSNANGNFTIDIACGATSLLVECVGYRPQLIPLGAMANQPVASKKKSGNNTPTTFAVIPLIAVDKQDRDRPYLQTEQTHYEQQTTASPATGIQRGMFVITDALTGQIVPAHTCLFFTKGQARNCYDSNAPGQVDVKFTEPDIVAIEVQSAGYQTYQGNLIIEKLDGQTLRHDIRLLRELTLLSIHINRPKIQITQCELRDEVTGKSVRMESAPGTDGLFGSYDIAPKKYILDIAFFDGDPKANGTQTVRLREVLNLQTGLNTKNINQPDPPKPVEAAKPVEPPKPTPPKAAPTAAIAPIARTTAPVVTPVSLPGLQLPETIPAIYFAQGDYVLRTDSEAVLQQVVLYMQTNPAYTLRVVGHTSNEGDSRLNQTLSENRAKVAASFVSRHGILDYRISITGEGDKTPLAPNDTEENKAKNRRVHLILTNNR